MRARVLFLAALGADVLVLLLALRLLPAERVPLHFAGSGSPDRFGSRGRAVSEMAAVVVVLAAATGGLALLTPRVPLSWVNLPARRRAWWTATPERTDRLRRMLRDDLFVVGAMTLALVAVVDVQTVLVADDPDPRLGPLFWVALVVYLAAVLAWVAHVLRGRYRPGEDA